MKKKKKEQPRDYYFEAYFNKYNFTHIFHKNKIDRLLSYIKPDMSVLDAGCGAGVFLYLLKKNLNCRITGVDIRKDQIHFAKNVCKSKDFFRSDLRTLDLGREFDFVNCSDVIEHFDDNERKNVIVNLSRHVTPEGYLLLAFPSAFYINVMEKIWKSFRKILYPGFRFDDDDVHLVVNDDDVCNILLNKGFSLKDKTSVNLGLINILLFKKGGKEND
jgi:2-polyprenyl-3-methyl-5-hydroxy-6-metoxy-1,4-benzoquinol methylase